jgi:hypothetical protein
MTEIAEQWRPIPLWEGFYEASSLGRIRSVSRTVAFRNARGTQVERWLTGRVLRPGKNKNGYLGVLLSAGEGACHREVQTLVCAAFHGVRPPGKQAAHANGVPADNRAINLRWATPAENAHDKVGHGTLLHGERHYAAKLTAAEVLEVRSSRASLRDLSGRYGICPQAVGRIKNKQAWRQVA